MNSLSPSCPPFANCLITIKKSIKKNMHLIISIQMLLKNKNRRTEIGYDGYNKEESQSPKFISDLHKMPA